MQDAQPEIRQKAAEIVSLTRPDDAVAFLQPLLQDPVGKVRAAAAATLSAIGGEAVVATLRTMAAEDQDWQVKMTCQAFLTRWEESIQENLAKDEAALWLKDTAVQEEENHA